MKFGKEDLKKLHKHELAQKNLFIEELQNKIREGGIATVEGLRGAIGNRGIDWLEVVQGIGWNSCDRCEKLGESDYAFLWLDFLDEENKDEKHILQAVASETNDGNDCVAVCWECAEELKERGAKMAHKYLVLVKEYSEPDNNTPRLKEYVGVIETDDPITTAHELEGDFNRTIKLIPYDATDERLHLAGEEWQ